MNPALTLLLALLLLLSGCRKSRNEPDPPPVNDPTPAPVPQDTSCMPLPPAPVGFGWQDSTRHPDELPKYFFANPLNGDELIVVVDGDAFGYNKMLNVNVRTGQRRLLAQLDQYLPSVNSRGWILFSTLDNHVYRIKTNGDSLVQMTSNFRSHDPKWDHTGTCVYYLEDAYNHVPAQLKKVRLDGVLIKTVYHQEARSAIFHKSEQVVLQVRGQGQISLVKKNLADHSEQVLLTVASDPEREPYFNHLSCDREDRFLYWSNQQGIFRFNLATREVSTVFANCERSIYQNPFVTLNGNEITYTHRYRRPLDGYRLLHTRTAYEMNTNTGVSRLIRIF